MKKVIFYSPLFVTGGMETAVFNLTRLLLATGRYEVEILYKSSSPESRLVFKKFKEICQVSAAYVMGIQMGAVYRPAKQPIFVCDVLINCSNWDFELPFVRAQKTIYWTHGTSVANVDKMVKRSPRVAQSVWQKEKLDACGTTYEVLPNIMDVDWIRKQAFRENTLHFYDYLVVSRISPEKGWDKLELFMKRPENKNKKVAVLGTSYKNTGYNIVEDLKKALKDQIIFLGDTENPYLWMANCGHVLVFSDFETYGLVSKEAHIVGKPVIFTNFPTAKDQFIEGVDSWYTDETPSQEHYHHLDYKDVNQESVLKRWEELINED